MNVSLPCIKLDSCKSKLLARIHVNTLHLWAHTLHGFLCCCVLQRVYTVQCSSAQCSSAQCSSVQCSHCTKLQCNVVNGIQCSAVCIQFTTVLYTAGRRQSSALPPEVMLNVMTSVSCRDGRCSLGSLGKASMCRHNFEHFIL